MMKSKPKSNGISRICVKPRNSGEKCLSPVMTKGDLSTPLDWECQFGHRFKASPLVLLGRPLIAECLPPLGIMTRSLKEIRSLPPSMVSIPR